MAITITERAAKRILEIKDQESRPESAVLRIGVAGGGCSGLSYKIDFDNEGPSENSKDQLFESQGIPIVVDMRSFLYLAGTELDYTDGLKGQGFHFVNPNASRTCSCGESFAV
ncbi:iron-sulfur cluster assembly protein [Cyclonatronum proteinivorum]|uniref:Iron-sulfur cluster assembly protein n=1 Tax=Cyclonatronum proteinivorum TaxID=1457365 RepID=A0A345UK51_9BACT|nr:iron-sulfur cluster assembly accessory protein [Cyclonatronum proteinivorum]AXJ00853.1 iron-sulfur cluster assembly protein [Cyclonatronum proteinivorum]